MNRRVYLFFFILGLLMVVGLAVLQSSPGYMDADYTYAIGTRLARGYGFSEPFLWNFLDSPIGIPHPSHAYWMPLPSILSAAGMVITRNDSFLGGRFLFL